MPGHGFAARAEHADEDEELQIVAEHCLFGDAVVEHPVICAVDRGIEGHARPHDRLAPAPTPLRRSPRATTSASPTCRCRRRQRANGPPGPLSCRAVTLHPVRHAAASGRPAGTATTSSAHSTNAAAFRRSRLPTSSPTRRSVPCGRRWPPAARRRLHHSPPVTNARSSSDANSPQGARPNDLLELMRAEALIEGDLVMCSHGDLIPEVLNRLFGKACRSSDAAARRARSDARAAATS